MGLRPTQVDEKPLLRFTHELVISTEANPDFLPHRSRQQPRMRLAVKRGA